MTDYVEISRSFSDLSDNEIDHSDEWFDFQSKTETREGWTNLLKSKRVILIAGGGAGKTEEMKAQVRTLRNEGRAAFFVPIEALADERLETLLELENDLVAFQRWLARSGESGWFFLDAVDELKLTHRKLERALSRFASSLGQAKARAHVILSCRPSDWNANNDKATFLEKLPLPEQETVEDTEGEDPFLVPFQREVDPPSDTEESEKVQLYRQVTLLPLSRTQIQTFAAARDVKDVNAFIGEIGSRNAWSFARRPFDLDSLISHWNAHRRIGSRLEQHQRDFQQAIDDDPERNDAGLLSYDRAVEGAERLALALSLVQRRTIRAPEHAVLDDDPSALDASEILTDWSADEIGALLRRPLFDPTAYGRIGFHHRSIQEYLAARRLHSLRQEGLSERHLFKLLLADRYGEHVLIPSMRPITAWVSLWEESVRREVLKREPEVLILHGDPESLPYDARRCLLEAFVDAYEGGDWRGLSAPIEEVQRLAQPDMADTIRSLWSRASSNDEVLELFLKLIWLGKIVDCSDLALTIAQDPSANPHTRIIAIRALASCNATEALGTLAMDLMAKPANWPDRVVFGSIDEFYPTFVTTTELSQLIERTTEPHNSIGGFSYGLYSLAPNLNLNHPEVRKLPRVLSELIRTHHRSESSWYNLESSYGYLAPALIRLCLRYVESGVIDDSELATFVVLSFRYLGQSVLARDEQAELVKLFRFDRSLRRAALWAEYDLIETVDPREAADRKLYVSLHDGVLQRLTNEDWDWLIADLAEIDDLERRKVALFACLDIWRGQHGGNRGSSQIERILSRLVFWQKRAGDHQIDELRKAVSGESSLDEIIDERTRPAPPNPKVEQWEQEQQQRAADRERERAQNQKEWAGWKDSLIQEPDAHFSESRRRVTVSNLIKWLGLKDPQNNRIGKYNWRLIRDALGGQVANLFEAELRSFWRNNEPRLWSTSEPEDRNRISGESIIALTGLLIESATEGWAVHLSDNEIRRAAEWSLGELNGFAEWLESLAEAQPTVVQSVLETELKVELDGDCCVAHPPTLHALRYGSDALRELAAPWIRERLLTWPEYPKSGDNETAYSQNLQNAFGIVAQAGALDCSLVDYAHERFEKDLDHESSRVWLNAVFAFDFDRGCEILAQAINKIPGTERQEKVILWLGGVFSDRSYHDAIPTALPEDARSLAKLVKLAYSNIRLSDDIHHEGVYTPGRREFAESARNSLLGKLINTPGEETHLLLLELAKEPLFEHMPDRLKILARERAASDGELKALSPLEFREWEKRFLIPPHSHDELYDLMLERIDDVIDDILNHDFSDRALLKTITSEPDIQPILARKFYDRQFNQYRVTREEEVAERKKTDIRLLATEFDGCGVIEIKIGDNNSVSELEKAITDQIIPQYLRHERCRGGCLLVTFSGRSGFKPPESKKSMDFDDVIKHLKDFAEEKVSEHHGAFKLTVKGLDLSS